MKEEKRHIDDFFREELGNFTEAPPASAWDALEKRLDSDQRPRRPFFVWWALLLIAALIGTAAILYQWNKPATNPMSAHKNTAPITAPAVTTQPAAGPESIHRIPDTPEADIATGDDNAASQPEDNGIAATTVPAIAAPPDAGQHETPAPAIAAATPVTPEPEPSNAHSRIRVHTDDGKGGDNTQAIAERDAKKANPAGKDLPYGRMPAATEPAATEPKPTAPGGSRIHINTETDTQPIAKQQHPANELAAASEETNIEGPGEQADKTATPPITERTEKRSGGKTKKTHTPQPAATKDKAPVTPGKTATSATNGTPRATSGHTASRTDKTKHKAAKAAAPVQPTHTITQTKTARRASAATGMATAHPKQQKQAQSPAPKNNTKTRQALTSAAPKQQKQISQHKQAVAADKAKGKHKKAATANTAAAIAEVPRTPAPGTTIRKKTITAVDDTPPGRPSNVEDARKHPFRYNPRYVDTVAAQKAAAARRDSAFAAKARQDSIAAAQAATSAAAHPPKAPYNSFLTGGLKGGYERGPNSYTAGKIVATAYVQYHLSDKLAISMEPSVKFANTNSANTKPYGNYYDVKSMDVVKVYTGGGMAKYIYTQTFDSVQVSTSTPRRYIEIEIPFMLQYRLSKHFELSGGLNFVFGKLINTSPDITTLKGYLIKDSIVNVPETAPTPAAPSEFSHGNSTPYSSYSYPPQSAGSSLRVGYMLGVNYNINERITLGVLMQQSLWNTNSIPDADIKKLYNQQYYRVSLGYQLFRTKKKAPAAAPGN